jgi:hypothetical protein
MPETTFFKWVYPQYEQEEWYDIFVNLIENIEAVIQSLYEDRNVIVIGGGNIELRLATNLFVWRSDFILNSFVGNGLVRVRNGSVYEGGSPPPNPNLSDKWYDGVAWHIWNGSAWESWGSVEGGMIVLNDGMALVVPMVRNPSDEVVVQLIAQVNVGNDHSKFILGFRNGNSVFLRSTREVAGT